MTAWEIIFYSSIAAIVVAWAVLVYFDRPRWRIITGRMGAVLVIVTLGIQFLVRH